MKQREIIGKKFAEKRKGTLSRPLSCLFQLLLLFLGAFLCGLFLGCHVVYSPFSIVDGVSNDAQLHFLNV
ncbi:MAG: hypothetical protein JWN45_2323 [Acidobacteriaceae bacterium]|nr:hypothetical protein [Acidobacteriaceae bacterium]